MGNPFKQIEKQFKRTGQDVIDIARDPLTYVGGPAGVSTNTATKAATGKTAGEHIVASLEGTELTSDGPEGESDIRESASNLVSNTPQMSLEDIMAASREQARLNLEMAPETSKIAMDITAQRTADLNKILDERHERLLPQSFRDEILDSTRGVRDELGRIAGRTEDRLGGIFDDISGVASDFLSGELPQDVKDFISDTRAEMNLSRGLFGDVASSATARDLGLTSLDLVNRGVEVSGMAANIASMEAASLGQLQQGISDQTRLLLGEAQAMMPPSADPTSIYGTTASMLAGASIINPAATMQTAAGVSQFNASTSFDAMLSELNIGMDLFSTQAQIQMNSDAIRSAERNANVQAGANVIGSLFSFI